MSDTSFDDKDDNNADDDIISKIMEKSGVTEEERMGMGDDSSTKDDDDSGSQQKDDQQQEQQKQTKQPVDDGTKQKAPAKDDKQQQQQKRAPAPAVDENGQVIAPPGAQRRLFEKYKKTAEVDYPRLEGELRAYKEAANFSRYELTAQEAITGYSLVKAWKEDPVKLIKHLLTQAKTAGINVDIGQAGVDTAAISTLIDQKLKPLSEAKAARERAQEADAEAERQYIAFVEKYPDAELQEEAIAKLIESDPEMTPTEAYFAAKAFFAQNGLDWNTPLRQQGATGAKRPVKNQDNRQGGLPRSRAHIQTNDDEDDEQRKEPVMAPASSSWSDIIKASMKDAGYMK